MKSLDKTYWQQRYLNHETGWNVGHATPPITTYIDTKIDKEASILIPGAGNGYEAEYLATHGYSHFKVLDFVPEPLQALKKRTPLITENHLILDDFFNHKGSYNYILEQTFLSAIVPSLRENYVRHMHHLLAPDGILAGVLFATEGNMEEPPFGGSLSIYKAMFKDHFEILNMETCYNSIPPRKGNELFIQLKKR